MAQAGSNYDEKNWRSKISLDCASMVYSYLTLVRFSSLKEQLKEIFAGLIAAFLAGKVLCVIL